MGVSFAIPMDVVLDVVEQIKEQGYVSRGWLGVVIQNVTRELAESFGLDKPEGALISRVMPNSPAAKAGLEAGDVILKFSGKDVATSASLPPLVGRTKVGETVPVVVMRDKKLKTLHVKIEKLAEEAQVVKTGLKPGILMDDRLSVEVSDLNETQRQKMDIEKGGVMISSLDAGPASKAGIQRGDVILSINNDKVKSAKQFLDLAKELPEGVAIPVLVQRDQDALFLALKIDN